MPAPRPILIIEDDEAIRQILVENIGSTGGFHSTEASTLSEATRYLDAADVRFELNHSRYQSAGR